MEKLTGKLTVKRLEVKSDKRGWLAEILRPEDVDAGPFGQVLITTAHPGEEKGNHYHKRKREWWCVIAGRARLTVTDRQTRESQSIELGERNMVLVEIPKNTLHLIENIGTTDMYLLAYIDEPFDPQDPDTYYE